MNWEAIGVVAEVVGAVGVIITLVYLAFQIRQNTNQLQGDAISAINEGHVTLLRDFRDDMELVTAYVKCGNDWESGSAQEQLRAHAHLLAYVSNFETAYNLWRSGALAERIYKNREDIIVAVISPPGTKTWWTMWSSFFDPEFAALITKRIHAPDARNIFDDVPFLHPKHWK